MPPHSEFAWALVPSSHILFSVLCNHNPPKTPLAPYCPPCAHLPVPICDVMHHTRLHRLRLHTLERDKPTCRPWVAAGCANHTRVSSRVDTPQQVHTARAKQTPCAAHIMNTTAPTGHQTACLVPWLHTWQPMLQHALRLRHRHAHTLSRAHVPGSTRPRT